MSKKRSYTAGNLKKIQQLVEKDNNQNIKKIVFPNNIQIGAGSNLPSTLNVGGKTTVGGELSVGGGLTVDGNIVFNGTSVDIGDRINLTHLTASYALITSLTGSLTRLSNGDPYIVAGDNIYIATQSNGSLIITSSASSGGGSLDTVETDTSQNYYIPFVENATSTTGETLRVKDTILFNPSTGNLYIDGDLTLGGGSTLAADEVSDLRLLSDQSVTVVLDRDQNTDNPSSGYFRIRSIDGGGSETTVAYINEQGDLNLDGDITIGNDVIRDSFGNKKIEFTNIGMVLSSSYGVEDFDKAVTITHSGVDVTYNLSSNNMTVNTNLTVNDFSKLNALRVGSTSTDPGDGNLYVEGTALIADNTTINGSLGTSDYARLNGLRVGSTSTDPGDGNLYVEGTSLLADDTTINGGLITAADITANGGDIFSKGTNNTGDIYLRRYDTSLTSGEEIGRVLFEGSEDNSNWGLGAAIVASTTENWTFNSNEGTKIGFWVTATGYSDSYIAERMALDGFGNLQIDGDLTVSGNRITFGSAEYIHNEVNGTVTIGGGHLVSSADNTYDLGTSSAAWRDLYLEGDINFSDSTEIDVASGNLTVDVDGDLILDADGGQIYLKDGGSQYGVFNLTSYNLHFENNCKFSSDGTMEFRIDEDNSETGQFFTFKNDTTEIAHLNESGNFSISGVLDTSGSINTGGDLTCVGGAQIQGSGGLHVTAGNATFDQNAFVNGYARIDALRVGTSGTSPGDNDLYVAGDATINHFARINALRVGGSATDPGDDNLYVEGNIVTAGGVSSYSVSTTNQATIGAVLTANSITSSVGVYVSDFLEVAGGAQIQGSGGLHVTAGNATFDQNAFVNGYGRIDGLIVGTSGASPGDGNLTVKNDLKVDDFALLNAVRIGSTDTDPGNGNLFVEGNIVQSTGGISTVAITTTNYVTVGGDLTVQGGDLYLHDNANIRDESSNIRMAFTDLGNITLRDASGNTELTVADGSVTITGDLFVNDYARIDALRVGTTSLDPGDGDLVVESTIRGAKIGAGVAPTSPLQVEGDTSTHYNSTNGTQGILYIKNIDTSMETGDTVVNIECSDDSMDANNYWIAFRQGTTNIGTINGELTYSPFTGQHIGVLSGSTPPMTGSIVVSTGRVLHRTGISNAWVENALSTTAKQKSVSGVFSNTFHFETPMSHLTGSGTQFMYNALGEGQILVTDEGGDIEVGDYICTSNRIGHGMKQDSDFLKNYTVAKANENINWKDIVIDDNLGFKSQLIACTYHCG